MLIAFKRVKPIVYFGIPTVCYHLWIFSSFILTIRSVKEGVHTCVWVPFLGSVFH